MPTLEELMAQLVGDTGSSGNTNGFKPGTKKVATDYTTGKLYDVSNPRSPQEVKYSAATGLYTYLEEQPLPGQIPPRPTRKSSEGTVWDIQSIRDMMGNENYEWYERPISQGQTFPQPQGELPTDPYGRSATWDSDNSEWRYPPDWGIDPKTQQAGYTPPITMKQPYGQDPYGGKGQFNPYTGQWEQPSGYISPADQWQIDLQKQQMAQTQQNQQAQLAWSQQQYQMQLEQEKQAQLASLRARPASWLEYASLSGQPPAVQPWMIPLTPPGTNVALGQTLPGWSQGAKTMAGLPELTTPSTQYLARMTPSSQQQYYGYEQARTGAPIEDIAWRLGQGAPPSGQNRGFTYTR